MTTNQEIAVLYDEDAIAERVDAIAHAIAAAKPQRLLVVAVLKGSFVFAADLIRAMHRAGLAPEMEFIHLSSYGAGTKSSGTVEILRDIESDVSGRDVLLVDDILESGRTLSYARDLIASRGAMSVAIAALLDKPGHRVADLQADYVGFTCPDKFVVGYGMDAAHAFRQLPYIGCLAEAEQ
ncbi:hypoxanthine phosphoribosyltransferase [Breoghania corrubedonensis]|uniref:Hypoxanthine phosphoribosyltransferase n=1 Tax=Breoghania corrubedonensis TaxID=665038 RepID=A0A2T5VHS6_9HYPH|nr:hypoxanthine phosphoribosyltransferase [Breoghania corrubedonensis]PTW63303.1 hypoxanthine phosphoribosyltransferase [Breoghania corrubedonensis]